jgi:beta-glucosidase
VGITLNLGHDYPARDSAADRAAAHRHDIVTNRWFLDPIFRGQYPAEGVEMFAARGATVPVEPGDLDQIAVPIDFLGVNNYFRSVMKAGPMGDGTDDEVTHPSGQYTATGWEVWPQGMHDLLVRLHNEYQPGSLYITENGAAFDDVVAADGHVHDVDRTAYLRNYIRSVQSAVQSGVPVRGYFVWSLLDNFEWAEGFSKRFGVIYVDYPNQQRILKDSALWYASAIRANAPID